MAVALADPPRSGAWQLALILVAAVTALRVVAIAVTPLEIYTDEGQYWLWGQEPAFGYYSKPPLIGWLLGAVSAVLGTSDFTLRLPAPLLHGVTAVLVGLLGRKLYGETLGAWAAAAYVTAPMTAVGGFLISTDTVMAPFLAAALLVWLPRPASGRAALGAGLLLGLAALAKYAAIYMVLGLALAALLVPAARVPWRHAALGLAGMVLALSPNILWNVLNGAVTLQHTAENADWGGAMPGLAGSARFLSEQLIVAGPLVFLSLVAAPLLRQGAATRILVCLAAPPILMVTVQAWLSDANANWAAAAYLPGIVAAVAAMGTLVRRLSLGLNAAICAAIGLLAAAPALLPEETRARAFARYENRGAVAEAILSRARAEGLGTVAAIERGLLSDLFYHGRDTDLELRSVPVSGPPLHHYELAHPMRPEDGPSLVAGVTPPCAAQALEPLVVETGAHRGTIPLWRAPAGCWP